MSTEDSWVGGVFIITTEKADFGGRVNDKPWEVGKGYIMSSVCAKLRGFDGESLAYVNSFGNF